MSITDFFNKIKGKNLLDKLTIFYIIIIILVAMGSFGLGVIYDSNKQNYKEDNNYSASGWTATGGPTAEELENSKNKKKFYVASKNSKIYYNVNCSGAKRIKEENKIWFSSREEAEKSGLTLATSCKE